MDFQFRGEVRGLIDSNASRLKPKAQILCECWQVSISYHLHMPLTSPAIKTSPQHSTNAGEQEKKKKRQKSVDVTTAPTCLVNITLIFTVFSVCVGPSSAKWILMHKLQT